MPTTYHLLLLHLAKYFPYNGKTAIKPFSEIILELRAHFIFDRLPNDYFFIKTKLSSFPNKFVTNQFKFPIKEKDEVIRFLKEVSVRYSFKMPLNKEWIDLGKGDNNYQNKPDLPTSFDKVNKMYIEQEKMAFPITDAKNIRITVKKLAKYYNFNRISDEWIEINKSKPILPSIDIVLTKLK